MPEPTQADFDAMDRRIRAGLGPEAGLVDRLQDGIDLVALLDLPAGKALIAECTRVATEYLRILTAEEPPSANDERTALLALRLNIGILRRMATTVTIGKQAEQMIRQRDAEAPLLAEDDQ